MKSSIIINAEYGWLPVSIHDQTFADALNPGRYLQL